MNLLPGEIVNTGDVTEVKVDAGAGTIMARIPTQDSDKGKRVNVGIRPEDMLPTNGESYAFEGTVEITEKLGEVTQIYFAKSEGQQNAIIGKLPGIHFGTRGQTMQMTAVPEKVHLFADGVSLLYR